MKKSLKLIIGAVVGIVAIICILFAVTYFSSKKLVCKSEQGNITIIYNKKGIKGYTAKDIGYDFDGQQEIAKRVGIEEYLDQFEQWFTNNTTGSCKR